MESEKINSYPSASGVLFPSMLQSMAAWRKKLGLRQFIVYNTMDNLNDIGNCKYCNGDKELDTTRGRARCICAIKGYEYILAQRTALYQDLYDVTRMEDFSVWGDDLSRETIQITKAKISKWIEWPNKWITLIGAYGSGKSTLLQIIANSFGPWAMYITMEKFERYAFQHKEANTLTVFEDHLSLHPILVLDDPGSEYTAQGRNFVRSVMRSVIKARYNLWEEYPLVIATNHSAAQLREYEGLIADRVLHKERALILPMEGVQSYRRQ